jgi:peptidylprolyl isomerase
MNKKFLIPFFAFFAIASTLWGTPQSQESTSVVNTQASSNVTTNETTSTNTDSNANATSSTSTEQLLDDETAVESQIHEEEETNIVQDSSDTNSQLATNTTSQTTNSALTSNSEKNSSTKTKTTNADLASGSTSTENILNLDTARISATFGYRIATNLMADPGFNFDLDSFIVGMRQAIDGKQSPMSDEEFMEAISKIQEKALQELSETNLSEANTFMSENTKNQSVVEINPGKLQYEVIEEGNGAEITTVSKPVIHFVGKYLDGMVFASSMDNESPIILPNEKIFSFRAGINGAKEGERRRVYVHPELGFGTKGFHPPNSLLVFDVTVVKANTEQSESSSEEISARMGLETVITSELTNTPNVDTKTNATR